jgi:hypothetical protein
MVIKLYGKLPKTGKDKESHSKQYDPPLPVFSC